VVASFVYSSTDASGISASSLYIAHSYTDWLAGWLTPWVTHPWVVVTAFNLRAATVCHQTFRRVMKKLSWVDNYLLWSIFKCINELAFVRLAQVNTGRAT